MDHVIVPSGQTVNQAGTRALYFLGYPNVGRSVPCAVTNSLFDPLEPSTQLAE